MPLSIIICGDAGKGKHNPYVALASDVRKAIILGLHNGQSIAELAKSSGVSENETLEHVGALGEGGFVKVQKRKALPNFFVASGNDVLRVRRESAALGRQLAEIYRTRWQAVVETYNELSASSRFGFERIGFVLIGAYSLDMIGKFAEEGDLMPRAPKRKTGRYYLWGVEDGLEALGRYGMHSGSCKNYGYASFGGEKDRQRTSPPDHVWSIIARGMNENARRVAYLKFQQLPVAERKALDRRLEKLTHKVLTEYERKYRSESHELDPESADYLRQWLYIDKNRVPLAPIYNEQDIGAIGAFADEMSVYIFDAVRRNLGAINSAFRRCRASAYASFPEFFCWYYHLAFTEAMDDLIRKQRLSQPVHGYEYWIWKI